MSDKTERERRLAAWRRGVNVGITKLRDTLLQIPQHQWPQFIDDLSKPETIAKMWNQVDLIRAVEDFDEGS